MKSFQTLLAVIPLLVVLLVSIVVNYRIGYFYYGESGKYLVNYLEDKPLLVKIFDYHHTDADVYRPRELGNVFNLIDSYLVLFFAWIGLPNFLSPLHVLSMFLIACFPVVIASYQKKHRLLFLSLASLLGIIFLTSPAPFMTLMYFRTSKSVLSLFIAGYFFVLYCATTSRRSSIVYPILIFFLAFSMGIIDEIGIIMSGLFLLYHIGLLIHSSSRKFYGSLFLASLLGIGGIFFYRSVISPSLTFIAIGEHPLLWGDVTVTKQVLAFIPGAVDLLFSYLGYLHGGIRGVVFLPVLLITSVMLFHSYYETWLTSLDTKRIIQKMLVIVAAIVCFVIVAIVSVGVALMISNHATILWEESRWEYYPLPFVTFWFLLISIAAFSLVQKYRPIFYILSMLLIFNIIVNVIRLPEYQQRYVTWWKVEGYVNKAWPLIDSIKLPVAHETTINAFDGREVIYILRKQLGRPIVP